MILTSVRAVYSIALTLLLASPGSLKQETKRADTKPAWEAKGTLFEACSCSVPCPCNFRESPSKGFCHTVYAYRLKSARFGSVKLDGLIFGGGEADKAPMGFLDSRANAEQKLALQKLALAVFGKGGPAAGDRTFTTVKLDVDLSDSKFGVRFGEAGGFKADIIIGGDGKTPIVVENNTIWPVRRFVKGKTTHFDYRDSLGNMMKFDGVNANLGDFDLKP